MLVISRKAGSKLFIGDDITLEFLEVKGKIVRVGISAPKDVRIVRHDAVKRDRNEAA